MLSRWTDTQSQTLANCMDQRKTIFTAERLVFLLIAGFPIAFGWMILLTGDVSISTVRRGVIWSDGDEATIIGLVMIGIGGFLSGLLLKGITSNAMVFPLGCLLNLSPAFLVLFLQGRLAFVGSG